MIPSVGGPGRGARVGWGPRRGGPSPRRTPPPWPPATAGTAALRGNEWKWGEGGGHTAGGRLRDEAKIRGGLVGDLNLNGKNKTK